MADYSPQIAKAAQLLEKFGALFTFSTSEVATSAPGKPWRVETETTDSTTAYAVKFKENGEWVLYVAAEGLAFDLADNMAVTDPLGQVWGIKENSLNPLDPAGDGQVIIYTAELTEWPT